MTFELHNMLKKKTTTIYIFVVFGIIATFWYLFGHLQERQRKNDLNFLPGHSEEHPQDRSRERQTLFNEIKSDLPFLPSSGKEKEHLPTFTKQSAEISFLTNTSGTQSSHWQVVKNKQVYLTTDDTKRGKDSEFTHLEVAEEMPHSPNFIWVNTSQRESFADKIQTLSAAITNIRDIILKKRSGAEWTTYNGSSKVVWLNNDTNIFQLSNYSQIKTIVLPWSPGQKLPRLYTYGWAGTQPLCEWINAPGLTKASWDAVYNRSCTTNITSAVEPRSIEPVYFHGKPINPRDYWPRGGLFYPEYFYTHAPDHLYYMNLLEDAVVLTTGDIYSRNLKVVPYACSQDLNPDKPENYDTYPIYSEVLIITQFWGASYFHMMLEVLPRLGPLLPFLHENPQISVHVPSLGGYMAASLKILGIGSERLIAGNCRAKLVYVPRATPCGFPRPLEMQMLSNAYQLNDTNLLRNLVLLIRRSGSRRFLYQMDIEGVVQKAAEEFGFEYYLFPDDPSPGLTVTREMFYRAVIIVAPHGAGLSNMVYSQSGTFVIETVCNPPHVNMCFQWTAHVLGHHYHGLASRGGCEDYIDIEPAMVDWVLRQYLTYIEKKMVKQ